MTDRIVPGPDVAAGDAVRRFSGIDGQNMGSAPAPRFTIVVL
ncbi:MULTISPECIES: hypothetical protein [unclassified Streptomyces]|nr:MULTISPECIES: hypothetical protein [unclassified Streptomyces]